MKLGAFGSTVYAQAMLLSALFSHHLAGGDLISGKKLLLGYFIIHFFLVSANIKNLSGPQLAIVILGVQSLSHFYFGMNSHSDLQMAASHIAGGFGCYAFISGSSRIFTAGSRILRSFFPQFFTLQVVLNNSSSPFIVVSSPVFLASNFVRSCGMRAPPLLGASHG